jgi:hypothetical protein
VTASLTPNRQAVLSALWWLYEGATFVVILADTSAAGTPPALDGDLVDWIIPTDYTLADQFDLYLTGGTVAYDATVTDRAELPQLVITLDYASTVTYTDVLILCIPAIDPGASAPDHAFPFVGVIHESSPITLLSTQSKTYNVDLFAEWL